jgi:metal-dependent amidase/aminoacylase/carboxypeptidase family protein
MKGTARWFRPEVGEIIEKGVHRLASGIAESFGAKADVRFSRHAPATVNDDDATKFAVEAAKTISGDAKVKHMPMPTMGGEDFAYMLENKQGAYLMLGGGRGPNEAALHHPGYDFNDAILPIGSSWYSTLVERHLARKG